MRPELTTLEQIDSYLAGNLSAAEQTAIAQKMASDPAFNQAVNEQKELAQAVNRKALRTQINTVAAGGGAGGGASFGNLFMGIGGVVAVGLITTGIIYFNQGDDIQGSEENIVAINNTMDTQQNGTGVDLYNINEEQLILEEPETIFSSYNNYEEEMDPDEMNVTVNFQSQGYGETVDYNQRSGNSGSIEQEASHSNNDIAQQDYDGETAVIRASRANFPGGHKAMDKFIDRNLRYPKSALNKGIEGVVRCDFHVTQDGLISEINAECIKMSEGDGPAFSDMRQLMNKKIENAFIGNATHILRTMPHWKPAKNSQGNAVLSAQRMYFNYDIQRGCLVYQLEDDVEILSAE